jgi:uncharacterized protein (TIGR02996 family)
MNQEEALLRDILENPDDDAPRLLYADWLDVRGNPRGEFIRVQCDLARMQNDDPRRARVVRREKALLRKHKKGWLEPLRGFAKWPVTFRRGFVEDIKCSLKQFLDWAEWLFRLTAVRHVWLNKGGSHVQALAELPCLAYLSALHLRENGLGDAAVGILAASLFVNNLTGLDLYGNGIGDAGAVALAASPHFVTLTTLDLSSNRALGDLGVTALARSRSLSNLLRLSLGYCVVGDAGAQALASSSYLTRLTTLDLSLNAVGNAGARALAASPNLANLTVLHLGMNAIGDAGALALADSPFRNRSHPGIAGAANWPSRHGQNQRHHRHGA